MDKMKNRLIQLTTPYVSRRPWGGSSLAKLKNILVSEGEEPVGETWEVSLLKDGCAKVGETPLNEIYSEEEITYLIKFLDTCDYLSVQVHPNEEYAQKYENSHGKTEMWIILSAKEGSGIYLGMKENTKKEDFKKALEGGAGVTEFLKFHPVEKGDFFFVPAGAIHAIGPDICLVEVQQSSGITYRVWDWGRVDNKGASRELHVNKAMEVIDFSNKFNSDKNFQIRRKLFCEEELPEVVNFKDFKVDHYPVHPNYLLEFDFSENKRAISIICLSGEVSLSTENEEMNLREFQSAVLSKKLCESVNINSRVESHIIIVS
jgi:mannose-6-phosphate isomerase